MKTCRQLLVLSFVAVCLASLVGGVHGVVMASEPAGPCCNNTPRQCEAASVCYDDGFCVDPTNMCNVHDGKCTWLNCNR